MSAMRLTWNYLKIDRTSYTVPKHLIGFDVHLEIVPLVANKGNNLQNDFKLSKLCTLLNVLIYSLFDSQDGTNFYLLMGEL